MNNIGLSTCYFAGKNMTPRDMVTQAGKMGFHYLECEYRLSQDDFHLISESDFAIATLHNFCPRPPGVSVEDADADYFRLSSPDEEERQKAVHYTLDTIRNASLSGAGIVILHLGDTGQPKERDEFRRLTDESLLAAKEGKNFFKEYLDERKRHEVSCFSQACRSLEDVLKEADKTGIRIGIENRYYLHQFPNFHELGRILDKFHSSPVGFWFDTGHAHVQGLWGMAGIDDYLSAYGRHLLGCHLHDATGRTDHMPPGMGDIDFERYKDFLKKDIPLILEVNAQHSTADFKAGIKYIKETLNYK